MPLISTCSPVVNIPVVTGFINQAIIEVQLFLCHVVQIFFSKEAKKGKRKKLRGCFQSKKSDTKTHVPLPKQNAVFQHSSLSALIEQTGSFSFYGFISSLLPWRQRDFNHIFLGICCAVTDVEASEWCCTEQRRYYTAPWQSKHLKQTTNIFITAKNITAIHSTH